MKLVRFGNPNHEKPAVLTEFGILDVSDFGQDFDERFFENDGLNRLQEWLQYNMVRCPRVMEGVRLGPPIARPSKIICIGLNYADHAKETGAAIPPEPIIFFKATSAICGPNDDVIIPRGSTKTDWEVELAVVIGKRASYISTGEAMEYVAGFMLHNDYSERAFQLERGGQWVKGKSCDTFAPFGPIMATTDELPNYDNLRVWLKVNGKTMQNSNTNQLIHKIPFLISYLSQFMTLLPGDVISTGTPAGVGLGMNPPIYLVDGDEIELGIDGLGTQLQTLKDAE